MVKFGSTVRIAVLPRDNNEPLYAIPVTLADTYIAHDAMKKGTEKVRDWLYTQATFLKKYQDITDQQLVELAKARGLVFDKSLTTFPELFFFESLSGNTFGHYIESYSPSDTVCTCPGFKHRGYCWASAKVKSGNAMLYKWADSKESFYERRLNAYGE